MEKSIAYHKKMVETKISKLIITLGIPTTISMLITNIYNMVDTYFVGTLGDSQQGATGILFTLQCIIQAIAFMLGHGSGTYLAKKLADKDVSEGSRYVSSAVFLGMFLGILLLIFGLILIEPFMLLLGSSDTILPYAKEYGLWVLISAPFMIASLVLNNNLRYEGKALFAMIGLVTGALLNILGDFIFINVLDLGVFGAGMSTGISQIISFGLLLIFYFKFAQTKIRFTYISLKFKVYWNIIRGGFPSFIRQGLSSISSGLLNNFTKPLGDAAVAAISVVNRYTNFLLCVGMGIGQGYQPVAAYNYQTKHYDRVKKGAIFTLVFSMSVVSVAAIISAIIPDKIMWLFNHSEEVIKIGSFALRLAALSAIIVPISVTANMMFQSIRKSLIASILSALRSGLVFIPILILNMQVFNLKFTGIAISQPLADVITSLISLPFFIIFLVRLKEPAEADADFVQNA